MAARLPLLLVLVVSVLVLVPADVAVAVKGNVKFAGDSDQGRKVKLVADERGRVVRVAATVLTVCTGRFEPFRARFEVREPLDRSTQDGFADRGVTLDEDGQYSARYRHEIEADYTGKHELTGEFSLEVVFRRDGDEYVTCEETEVGFVVNELKAS